MANYSAPKVVLDQDHSDISADFWFLLFFIPAYLAVLYYGSSWAWCQATCGWGRVQSCSSSWGTTKAVCRR